LLINVGFIAVFYKNKYLVMYSSDFIQRYIGTKITQKYPK